MSKINPDIDFRHPQDILSRYFGQTIKPSSPQEDLRLSMDLRTGCVQMHYTWLKTPLKGTLRGMCTTLQVLSMQYADTL